MSKPSRSIVTWGLGATRPRIIPTWENNFNNGLLASVVGGWFAAFAQTQGLIFLAVMFSIVSIIGTIGLIVSLFRGMLGYILRRLSNMTHVTVYDEFWDEREGSEPTKRVERLKKVEGDS